MEVVLTELYEPRLTNMDKVLLGPLVRDGDIKYMMNTPYPDLKGWTVWRARQWSRTRNELLKFGLGKKEIKDVAAKLALASTWEKELGSDAQDKLLAVLPLIVQEIQIIESPDAAAKALAVVAREYGSQVIHIMTCRHYENVEDSVRTMVNNYLGAYLDGQGFQVEWFDRQKEILRFHAFVHRFFRLFTNPKQAIGGVLGFIQSQQ